MFLGIIILYVIAAITNKAEALALIADFRYFYYETFLQFLYLLLGFIIEGNKIVKMAKNRSFKINWWLVSLSLILIALTSSSFYLVIQFGYLFMFTPFLIPEVAAVITVLSGILIVRAFCFRK